MSFNSVQFLIFLPIVVLAYYALPKALKNMWLLVCSYYFYMCWNAGYAVLILFSTLSTYLCSYLIELSTKPQFRKVALWVNIIVNLGILFFFKYYNFFNDSIAVICEAMGIHYTFSATSVLLPVGISFYTFQALGYSIDVYRKTLAHEKNLLNYMLFVSFFPQLVAGPIERATNLLPQFREYKKFDYTRAAAGSRQMLWGFYKKVVISNGCESLVKAVYTNPQAYDGLNLVLATMLFAFQIYGDFSGYSDIAIGAARILGFDLMRNFNRPYFAQNITDFWRRWHISLSTWFKDYVYIPLGGNRCKSEARNYFNVFATMLVSGLWHGANWTYVVWGAYHGLLSVLSRFTYKLRMAVRRRLYIDKIPVLPRLVRTVWTFILVCIGWVFFCASDMQKATYILTNMLNGFWTTLTDTALRTASLKAMGFYSSGGVALLFCIGAMLILELFENDDHPLMEVVGNKPFYVRWPLYYGLVFALLFFGGFGASTFIYFQF